MDDDFRDLLSAFSAAEVRFLVVGAYAVGVHGHPRATKDLDVWIEATRENASRVLQALRSFGAPLGDLGESDLAEPGTGFMMGLPPRRIDVLTRITAVEFADAWRRRIEAEFAPGLRCPVIGLEDLLVNKRAMAASKTSPTSQRSRDSEIQAERRVCEAAPTSNGDVERRWRYRSAASA